MLWNDEQFVGADFETDAIKQEYALQPWRARQGTKLWWPTSFVAAREMNDPSRLEYYVDKTMPSKLELRRFLLDTIEMNVTIVGWNLLYDIQCFLALGDDMQELVLKAKWLDGMLLWRHYFIEPEYDMDRTHKKSYRLKDAVREIFPEFANYEEGITYHNPTPEQLVELHSYNRKDTVLALRLAKYFFTRLDPEQQRCALIEAKSLPLVAISNFHGMCVDQLAAAELGTKLVKDAEKALKVLAPHGVTEKVVKSPKQLSELMFNKWGLPVLKKNTSKKTGNETNSTDKEVLHELAFLDPRAKTLREYRDALNNKTKFVDTPVLSAIYCGDNRSHPQAIIFGTYSGRMTYASSQGKGKDKKQTGYAQHQMKREKVFRASITAPDGYDIVEFDASGQEFRWMACASGDATMLGLCQPGEDPHSFMGARIEDVDYREMMRAVKAGEEWAAGPQGGRMMGKVGNLCVIEGSLILTDRGVCNIEHVRRDDLIWDGVEFVAHEGVVCSGVELVISHDNVTATPEHKVSVDGVWIELVEAARYDRSIEPAMGSGWADQRRTAVRIMDGLIRRAVSEVRGALYSSTVWLWDRARRQLGVFGDWTLGTMQGVCCTPAASQRGSHRDLLGGGQTHSEASERMVPAMHQSEGQIVAQLRRSWDRVPVLIGQGSRRVHQDEPAPQNILGTGHRPNGQRWSLRDWKLALGYAKAEPCQQATARVYDIVNCGPRHRFACNGRIVHNSLQYRTSAKKLMSVARVQYLIPMELPTARIIHRKYQQTYPGVPIYWENQIRIVRKAGFCETFGGRRVQVTGNWNGDWGWSMGSTAINYRIQGTGADQKYLALACLTSLIVKYNAIFAWDFHDGIYFYVPKKYTDFFRVEGKKILDNLPYRKAWGYTPPIPMPWDAKVGSSWGNLHEVKE